MSALFFADFETTTSRQSSDSTRVWIWGIKGNLPGDVMEFGLDLNSFFDHVSEKKIKEIYFHNLSFDGNFMFKHMLKTYKSHFKRNSPEDRIALEENEWS